MNNLFLGLVFNITVLILEYKRAAFAQTFSLGYKPIRPSYFYPEHPGHRPPLIIPQGWLWPSDPDEQITTTSTTQASTIIQVPNRRPDLPNQLENERPLNISNTEEINHWFRPVIITNTMSISSGIDKTTRAAATTDFIVASTTGTSIRTPTAAPGIPPVQFLPEGDLFTSAPVGKMQAEILNATPTPPASVAAISVNTPNLIMESPEGNLSVAVADLLPLPIELGKNGSAENINFLLPALPLKAVKNSSIS